VTYTVRYFYRALVICGALFLAACGEVVHQEYYPSRTELVQLKSDMSCENPVVLTIGCDKYRLANLTANLHGVEMALASTADGTSILVWSSKKNDYSSMTANLAFDAVRTELEKNKVRIISITAVTGSHFAGREIAMGYLLALDQDGFRYLSPYAIGKKEQ
jgi:hypothetical protein